MASTTSRAGRPRPFGVAALAVALASGMAMAEPYVPDDDRAVLARVAPADDPDQAEIEALKLRMAGNPEDADAAMTLARLYIQIGRGEADPRFNGYAQAVLTPWLAVPKPSNESLVLMATIEQSRHRFDEALGLLDRALSADPEDAQAWLTRAVILHVQGRYDLSLASCGRLAPLVDQAVVVLCAAGPASLHGEAKRAYRTLEGTLAAVADDAELGAWARTLLGEIAERRGDGEAAEAHFRAALAGAGPDPYLLGAYADLLLGQGRPEDVIDLLGDAARIDALLLRLAIAHARLDSPEGEAMVQVLADRFQANRLRGDVVHLREEARFALDLQHDPQRALELALENWAVQREPWDARLVLAAAIAAGATEKALPVVRFIRENGIEDVDLARLVADMAPAP